MFSTQSKYSGSDAIMIMVKVHKYFSYLEVFTFRDVYIILGDFFKKN